MTDNKESAKKESTTGTNNRRPAKRRELANPAPGSSKKQKVEQPTVHRASRPARKAAERRTSASPAAAKQPPVMARSYDLDASSTFVPGSQAARRKSAKNPRRRFDVSLGIPGAEMRLPSLPAIRFSLRWLVLGIAAVLLVGLYFLWQSDLLRVNTLVVEGVSRVRSSEVEAVLDIAGKPMLLLRPAKLTELITSAFPEFSSAAVKISWPDQVKVSVIERQPVLTWSQGGRAQLIDREGFIFPLRLEAAAGAASVITPLVEAFGDPPGLARSPAELAALVMQASDGDEFATQPEPEKNQPATPFVSQEMVTAILEMGKIAPAGAPLVYDPARGLGWQDGRGWQVYLGKPEDITAKLFVYQALINQLLSEGTQPELVSIEYVHTPYFTKAEEPAE